MSWFHRIGVICRRHAPFFATVGCVGFASVYFIPQTLGLPYYKRLLTHYKDGVMSPVDNETQQLIEKVCALVVCCMQGTFKNTKKYSKLSDVHFKKSYSSRL